MLSPNGWVLTDFPHSSTARYFCNNSKNHPAIRFCDDKPGFEPRRSRPQEDRFKNEMDEMESLFQEKGVETMTLLGALKTLLVILFLSKGILKILRPWTFKMQNLDQLGIFVLSLSSEFFISACLILSILILRSTWFTTATVICATGLSLIEARVHML